MGLIGTVCCLHIARTGLYHPRPPLSAGSEARRTLGALVSLALPRLPNVPLLWAFWFLFDGIWGVLRVLGGVLVWQVACQLTAILQKVPRDSYVVLLWL